MKPNLWMYSDEVTMNRTAASLICFGAEVFKRAKLIRELDSLKQVFREIRNPEIGISLEPRMKMSEFGFEYLIDCIRILIFFENYTKAVLISRGFCVQSIKREYGNFKQLRKEQFERPVTLEEINHVEPFQIDKTEQRIHHNALAETTIGLKILLEVPQYLQHYQFEPTLLNFLRELNSTRNTLHLHTDLQFSLSKPFIENIEKVNEFVDNTIAQIVSSPTQLK